MLWGVNTWIPWLSDCFGKDGVELVCLEVMSVLYLCWIH